MTSSESQDPRIAHTLASIENAVVELIKSDPGKPVSISDLCKKAGISRVTFYKHFQSVEELISHLVSKSLEKMSQELESRFDLAAPDTEIIRSILDWFLEIFGSYRGNETFVWYANTLRIAYIDSTVNWYARYRFGAPFSELDEQEKTYISFMIGGITNVLFSHLRSGEKKLTQEATQTLLDIFKGAQQTLS